MPTDEPTRRRHWDLFAQLDARSCWRPSAGASPWHAAIAGAARAWCPPIDVAEDEDELVVTMELAGGRREDVEVECRGDTLVIRGEKRSERSGQAENRRYIERTYGAFTRTVLLPASVEPASATATFDDGVLTIRIRKRESGEARQVSVT